MTPEQIVSKWIETEWLSHDPAIKDAEEAIVVGLVADIKAAIEAEREECAKLREVASRALARYNNPNEKHNTKAGGYARHGIAEAMASDLREVVK